MDKATRDSITLHAIAFCLIAFFIFCMWAVLGGDPFGTKAARRDRVSELACMEGGNFWVEGKCRATPDTGDE